MTTTKACRFNTPTYLKRIGGDVKLAINLHLSTTCRSGIYMCINANSHAILNKIIFQVKARDRNER